MDIAHHSTFLNGVVLCFNVLDFGLFRIVCAFQNTYFVSPAKIRRKKRVNVA
jgi:hypothetical protein